ncbi:MAG TPA: SusD/RagB family nutrient-binding outer membrane lipoprotein, partial [Chitinophagales bacterium]|nr:SusD/RagB family nutrient-binding outer membrane lipoprotein [Chitinophagales bacterium]
MKKIFIIFAVGLSLASCKKLSDMNVDTKNAENGEAPSETLFANATRNLSDQVETPSVNFNVLRCCAQFWTETTYTDESNYDLTTRKIPDTEFITIYRDVLSDLKEAKKLVEKEGDDIASPVERKNKIAVTEILSVYAFQREVDIFGNVPYSDALNIDNVLPKYDDAQSIYAALFARLDEAINSIDVNQGGFPSGSDVIYGGNMMLWKQFANSLKLKMAITVADVTALNPGAKATEAVASGVLSSPESSARYQYLGASPNANPIWVQLVSSGRYDWVASNTLVDK